MTENYLTNITPDSFSGLLFGFEGMKNTVVLLNGPTGCKFYHSAVSDDQGLRQWEFDPLNYPMQWYFGQPRIPCTYLDKRDYIYGGRAKLEDAMAFLQKNMDFDLLVVVNSPGAALIGDNLKQIVGTALGDRPYLTVESPGYSRYVWEGYDAACQALIRKFAEKSPKTEEKPLVNLLGLSIQQKYYLGDLQELTRLLGLCGIGVNCALCCQSSLSEVKSLPKADLNIVVHSEYGLGSAKLLEEKFGTPWMAPGLPMGFSATEGWLRQVCAALNRDPAPALLECQRARAKAYIHVSRVNSLTGMPKGVRYAVHGTISQCLGYTRFLTGYLGMTAACISLLNQPDSNPVDYAALEALLKEWGMEGALGRDILQTEAELVFADANILSKLRLGHHRFSGIEISLPSFGYIDVIPKTHLGVSGTLLMTEQVLNGLLF